MADKKEWIEPKQSPKVFIDVIVEKGDSIVLVSRAIEPFKGKLVVIGGFVEYDETVENAAVREVKEETGLDISLTDILGVYSDKNRDTRFHTISVAFIAKPVGGKLRESFEGSPEWVKTSKIAFRNLGFDHGKIVSDYIRWKKRKGTYWSTR